MNNILLLFNKPISSSPAPPVGESFWVEDGSGDQMITDTGDTYVFVTES